MKIGDEVYVHGYVDEIRNDTIIIRNEGGYFGTVPSEVAKYVKPHIYGKQTDAIIIDESNCSEKPNNCEDLQDLKDWKDQMWAEAIVTEPTISKMEQVDDDAYFLELMGAVERGEISDAGANQAWYEYINHEDEPQKWETPPKFEHKGTITTCVSVPACLLEIEDEPQTERYCTNCKHNGVIEDYECRTCNSMNHHEFIQSQTDCAWK